MQTKVDETRKGWEKAAEVDARKMPRTDSEKDSAVDSRIAREEDTKVEKMGFNPKPNVNAEGG